MARKNLVRPLWRLDGVRVWCKGGGSDMLLAVGVWAYAAFVLYQLGGRT